jgi:hypothetical protein
MKLLLRLVALLAIALVGGAIALYAFLPSAARTAVEVGSQEALGVPAGLGGLPLSLGPNQASLGLEELSIANPEPFADSSLLEVDLASVSLDTASVLGEVVRVREVRLDGVRLNLLQKGSTSNLAWFLKRLASEPGDTAPAEEEPSSSPEAAGQGKKLAVDRVLLSGITARLELTDVPLGAGSYEVTLPAMDLDLSDAEPGDTGSLLRVVLRELIDDSLEALEVELPPGTTQALLEGGGWRAAGDAARSVLEEKGREEVDRALEKLPTDLKNPLKGLLGD